MTRTVDQLGHANAVEPQHLHPVMGAARG
jgi:hypothetical protein